jgi:aspartate-semialdehyde dehydrogenase
MANIRVGILGATGEVGKNYIRLLENHPEFRVTYVAASPNSKGKSYSARTGLDSYVGDLILGDANEPQEALGKCSLIVSAFDADPNLSDEQKKLKIQEVELSYARLGFPVVSNNSPHRFTKNIPMIIPEINPEHLEAIKFQESYKTSGGFIVVKPNCNIQSFMIPIHALRKAGYAISDMNIVTLQAISGDPSIKYLDMNDNLQSLDGERKKTETEPLKIFGTVEEMEIINDSSLVINGQSERVPISNGHTALVSLRFRNRDNKPKLEEITRIWNNFKSLPQELGLYSAPNPVIVKSKSPKGPEVKLDRDNGRGMAITYGQLRECKGLFDYSFKCLSHNTIRGAAGGAILTAELLHAKGYF